MAILSAPFLPPWLLFHHSFIFSSPHGKNLIFSTPHPRDKNSPCRGRTPSSPSKGLKSPPLPCRCPLPLLPPPHAHTRAPGLPQRQAFPGMLRTTAPFVSSTFAANKGEEKVLWFSLQTQATKTSHPRPANHRAPQYLVCPDAASAKALRASPAAPALFLSCPAPLPFNYQLKPQHRSVRRLPPLPYPLQRRRGRLGTTFPPKGPGAPALPPPASSGCFSPTRLGAPCRLAGSPLPSYRR